MTALRRPPARRPVLAAAAAAALVTGVAVAVPAQACDPATLLFTFADERITESSGLEVASLSKGVLFTHNDSGDGARFFAVDRRGRTLATYTVPGPRPSDWEDMTLGPDEQGRSSLWFGDIGGNAPVMETVVTRVPEPVVPRRTYGAELTTAPGERFRLRYPDGPHDAESLFADPRTGQLFVVSKAGLGVTGGIAAVYAAPPVLLPEASGATNPLTRIGEVVVAPTTTDLTTNAFYAAGSLATTGADMAPDGSRIVVRTYTDAYEYVVPAGGSVADAFAPGRLPTRTPLPVTEQGEGVAYSRDSRSLLVSSERGEQPAAPVHRVDAGCGGVP